MEYKTDKTMDYLEDDYDIFINKVSDGNDYLHAHEFIEFSYVESGQGVHFIAGTEEPLEAGDVYIINTNVPHEYRVNVGEFVIYNCIFQPCILDDSLQNFSNFLGVAYNYLFHTINAQPTSKSYLRLSTKQSFQIGDLFREMYQEYTNRRDGYRQILQADVKKLLVYMFRLFEEDSRQAHDPHVYREMIVQSVKDYLAANYRQPIKCDDLAKQFYLSTGHFSRLFKQNTGKTVIRYLQDIRIENACGLLKTTELSVEKVMASCGYTDIKHFYDVFHRSVGQTPGAYRKAQGGSCLA